MKPKLTARFEWALAYAARLHRAQTRKGKSTPYVAHLMSVTAIALEHGGDEDQAIGALLHDAAEDQGGRPVLRRIHRKFGPRVARIVEGCTDTFKEPKPNWLPRKAEYLAKLPSEPKYVQLVSAADKLNNVREVAADWRAHGDRTWKRFKGKRDGTIWYYRTLLKIFRSSGVVPRLIAELARAVRQLPRPRTPNPFR